MILYVLSHSYLFIFNFILKFDKIVVLYLKKKVSFKSNF